MFDDDFNFSITEEFDAIQKTFFEAVKDSDLEALTLLLSKGTLDINIKTKYFDETALHLSSKLGHEDITRFLAIDKKAELDVTDMKGWTPLHFACSKGHDAILRILIAEANANINSRCLDGFTPLHLACL